jgi:U1 small nuclear ribonucleoprotein
MVAKVREKMAAREKKIEEAAGGWDPQKDPNVEGEPLKTLFVANLSGDVSERKLKREFEEYGPIKRIRLVHDKYSGKPKGYAFIEFEHKSDMKEAYKMADGTKIEGKRCLVDVERGRTVPGWRPKRLGGGKDTNAGVKKLPKDVNKHPVLKLVYKNLGMETREHDAAAKTEVAPRDDRFVDRHRDRPRDDFRPAPRIFDSRERDGHHNERHRKRDRSSERSRDRRHRSRDRYGDRERYSRKRERSPYSRDDDRYAAIPPPESLGGPPRADFDEPEEGEYHP